MLLLTKAKRPLKFKMLCGFNKHAVKLRMHKAALYAFRKQEESARERALCQLTECF